MRRMLARLLHLILVFMNLDAICLRLSFIPAWLSGAHTPHAPLLYSETDCYVHTRPWNLAPLSLVPVLHTLPRYPANLRALL